MGEAMWTAVFAFALVASAVLSAAALWIGAETVPDAGRDRRLLHLRDDAARAR